MVVRRLLWMVSKEGASAATRATELAAAVGRGGERKAGSQEEGVIVGALRVCGLRDCIRNLFFEWV